MLQISIAICKLLRFVLLIPIIFSIALVCLISTGAILFSIYPGTLEFKKSQLYANHGDLRKYLLNMQPALRFFIKGLTFAYDLIFGFDSLTEGRFPILWKQYNVISLKPWGGSLLIGLWRLVQFNYLNFHFPMVWAVHVICHRLRFLLCNDWWWLT